MRVTLGRVATRLDVGGEEPTRGLTVPNRPVDGCVVCERGVLCT